MMIKTGCIVILTIMIIVIGINCVVLADSIIINKPVTREAKPGELTTMVFTCNYNGDKQETILKTRLKGPEGWSVFSPAKKYNVKAGDKASIFVTAAIPSGAKSGSYGIELIVEQKDGKLIKQKGEINVLPVKGFGINVITKSTQLHPGESTELAYQIINKGNVKITIEFNPYVPEKWSYSNMSKQIIIKPGESKKLLFTVTAPLKTEPGMYSLLLNIRMDNMFKSVYSSITVLPPYPRDVGGTIWWKIPGEFSLNGYYGTKTPLEMSGSLLMSGKLPEEHWVTLVWDQELNTDIKMPTLTVGKSDLWYVRVGRVIQGSSLVKLDGIGGQINRKISPGFCVKGTLVENDNDIAGALEGKWALRPECKLTIGVIKLDDLYGYSRLNYFPSLNWNIEGEIANNFNKNSLAWKVDNELLKGKCAYNIGYEHYNKGFTDHNKRNLLLSAQREGEITDLQFTINQKYSDESNDKVVLKEQEAIAEMENIFANKLRLNCTGEHTDTKREDNDTLVDNKGQIEFDFPVTKFMRCNMGIMREKRKLEIANEKGQKDFWNIGINGHTGPINWQSSYYESITEGSDEVYKEIGLGREWRVRLSTNVLKTYLWWERIKLEEEWENPEVDVANIYGVMLPFTLVNNHLYSTLGYNYEDHSTQADVQNISGSLNLRFSNDVNMYLCANNIIEEEKDDEWNVSFGINRVFKLPLYGTEKLGRIEGYVFVDKNNNGKKDVDEEGIKDVVIISESGQQALSNESGYFKFSPMEPGNYNLFVRNLPKWYVLNWKGNIKVKLPKDVIEVPIPVQKQSVINLDFFIDKNEDGKYQSGEEGVEGILFVLNSNKINKIYKSDSNGNISIGVPEGLYTITINKNSIPKWHKLKDDKQIKIKSSCNKITEVKVPLKKVERKLNITVVMPYTDFDYDPELIKEGESVLFDAGNSTSMNGIIKKYIWEFGNKVKKETKKSVVKHIFKEKGKYLIKLTVIDSEGGKGIKTKIIEVK